MRKLVNLSNHYSDLKDYLMPVPGKEVTYKVARAHYAGVVQGLNIAIGIIGGSHEDREVQHIQEDGSKSTNNQSTTTE